MHHSVCAVEHPLVEHHLSYLRDIHTSPDAFRRHLRQLAVLLAYEATQDLPLKPVEITTPLTTMAGKRLNPRVGLVPILRAGLGMVDPILDLLPSAEVWHLGLYRDEQTAEPVEYYSRLDQSTPVDLALIVDPMLATGGSALAAIEALRRWGVSDIRLLSVIAAPEGLAQLTTRHPDVSIHVCSIDDHLNARKFIVPGLGDAGDRCFNTLA